MPKPAFCLWCGNALTRKTLDDVERLVCSSDSCSYVHWDNPTPVVAAIVERDGEVILAHNKAWPPQWFALITGFLEKNESPEDGVIREVKEELNLDVEIVEFVGLYPFPQANEILMVWHVRGEGEITLNEELDAWKSLPPEKVKPWPMGTGLAVRDWLLAKGLKPEMAKL